MQENNIISSYNNQIKVDQSIEIYDQHGNKKQFIQAAFPKIQGIVSESNANVFNDGITNAINNEAFGGSKIPHFFE